MLQRRGQQQQAQQPPDEQSAKSLGRLAQRVQREATGYYCGYTFKGQVVGKKYLLKASQSLDYLTPALENKTSAQRMHRTTNRMFADIMHRAAKRRICVPLKALQPINMHKLMIVRALLPIF